MHRRRRVRGEWKEEEKRRRDGEEMAIASTDGRK